MERHKNDPFAVLGINTDEDKETYRKRAAEMEVNWRSAWEGSTGGKIPMSWNIQYYPSVFVIDSKGKIRYRDVRGVELDQAVATLLAEI